jgi:4-diphosphocytidyl-2-C-methyl-D-erythritol kinase
LILASGFCFSMPSIRLRAFAKINLGLRILARRPDHYHEIRTMYQAISLADLVTIELGSRSGEIVVETDDPSVPDGPENLAYRACDAWRKSRGWRRAVRIRIEKKIPSASGLGGASSDAAVTLIGLERLTGDRLPLAERLQLAAELGSDVPFFLIGGRALGCGRGEEVYPLDDLPNRHCLVIFPGYSQSTREAYAAAGSRLTSPAKPHTIYSFGMWPQFPVNDWGPAENDFEAVVFAKWPELGKLKRQLLRAGAEMASLSGSGSAVYAIFDSARKLISAQRSVRPDWRSFGVHTLRRVEYHKRMIAR